MAIIIVPEILDGATAASVAEHFGDRDKNTTIDFARTRTVTLEAIATLLAICAQAPPDTITWRFSMHRDIDDFHAAAMLAAPVLTQKLAEDTNRLEQALRHGRMRRGTFATNLQHLRNAASSNTRVLRWLNARLTVLEVAPLVGYLFRIGAFAVARELKIIIVPDAAELPQIHYDIAADTGTIPLTPLHTIGERRAAMGRLADIDELARIFGKYAGVDFVRGGALAEIVVAELGSNVTRHACCTQAWLGGRVVPQVIVTDPLLRPFVGYSTPLFEMLVADDGKGIHQTLGEHFRADKRDIINDAYGAERNDVPSLLAYAFERFSSSKPATPNQWDATAFDHQDDTASGLYWIWNFVRSKGGTLGIASGGHFVSWDFTTATARAVSRPRSELRFGIGTMIRIVLPLHDDVVTSIAHSDIVAGEASPGPWKYASLDDLNIPDLVADEGSPAKRDKIWSQLDGLGRNVHRGEVLVVDVGSLPRLWVKDAAYPLVQWAAEANVTGPSGDVAVLLVNLPDASASVFELAARETLASPRALVSVRRAVMLVFESGKARAVASSAEVESALMRLYAEGTLATMDLATNNIDHGVLRTALRDNAHIVREIAPDLFTLRVWYLDLVEFLRREHLTWLEQQVDHSPSEGGIRLGGDSETLFRLPATGRLSRVFFHFRSLFSNRTALYRLTWLFSDAIDQLERERQIKVDALVSVTRPPVALVEHLVAFRERKEEGRRLPALMASTLDELIQTWYLQSRPRYDNAILIQSVINSGATIERVATAIPIGWIATIVCADTRILTDRRDHLGGEVIAFVDRPVSTISPVGAPLTAHVVAIDEVSISPVLEDQADDIDTVAIWSYLENTSSALRVGHHEEVNYHHYVYYVDTAQLLTATDSEAGTSLMERIVAAVVASVGTKGSDELVILHPPAAISEGERIAVALQHATGARFRHVVYRDSIAGQWRFSPYADLGLPLSGATVIIVDDGSNTGDTLMGLIAAALSGSRPASLVVAVAVSRLPAHRAILFQHLRNIAGVDVNVVFFSRLEMPVYAAPACPICRYSKALADVPSVAPSLGPAVNAVRRALRAQRDGAQHQFLFKYSTVLAVGRLRESIERVSYDSGALVQLTEKLDSFDDNESDSTLDFAFIAASEPDVLRASVLAPYYYPMLAAFVERIECCDASELPTYIAAVARAVTRVLPASKDEAHELIVRGVWHAALRRHDMTPRVVAIILALVLAEATDGAYNDILPRLANLWISELAAAADRKEGSTLVHAFGLLYARDAARTRRFIQTDLAVIVASAPIFLFRLATDVAANFWAHASENIRALVELIRAAATGRGTTSIDDAASKIASKLTNLLELKSTLQAIDSENMIQSGDTTGALVAWGDEVDRALTEMVIGLVDVTRPLNGITEKVNAAEAAEALVGRWHKLRAVLDPLFMNLFPDLREVMAAWADSTANLPSALVGPVQTSFGQYDRVFIPRPLLQRFIHDAIENCLHYAFPGEAVNDPRSRIEARLLTTTSNEGHECVLLEILDSGPTLGVQKREAGHGFGLKHLRRLVPPFGGSLDGPTSDETHTVIRLMMRKKETAPNVTS
jgi:hypothetical protein